MTTPAKNAGRKPAQKAAKLAQEGRTPADATNGLNAPESPPKLPKGNARKIDLERAIELRRKGVKLADIAELFNVTVPSVSQALQPYTEKFNAVETYKAKRAEIFAEKQRELLSALDETAIKKMSGRDLVIAAATLYDKERLERGQSTSNVSVLFNVSDAAEKLRRGDETVVDITPKASTGAAPDGDGDTR